METSTAGLEARLARLEDIHAILALRQRYILHCDNGYPADLIAELFTDDGEIDWGPPHFGSLHGRAQIHEYFAAIGAQFSWALHYIINMSLTISPDGKEANGFWYIFQPSTLSDRASGDKQAVWFAGTSDDDFVKLNGEWKIRRMKGRIAFSTPYEQGWLKERYTPLAKAEERWRTTRTFEAEGDNFR